MNIEDHIAVDINVLGDLLDAYTSGCEMCARVLLKDRGASIQEQRVCRAGEWNCGGYPRDTRDDNIIWLSRVDHAALVMEGKL